MKAKLDALPPADREHLARLIEELKRRKNRELSQVNFLAFVQSVWPGFIYGRHHARMAQEFEKVVSGECKRLIINLGPRHSKSEFGSYLLPAWFLGKNPAKKIIQCSHTADLAVGFGRKVRNLVGSAVYQDIFPGVGLQADSKAAGRWNTSAGGDYFAIGVGGAVTGKGADILIVDDPHALTVGTLIPTTKGFKTVADIAIGDEVFGPDGKPTRVIDKSDVWKDRPVYEVTTDDNVTVECDGGHIWNYRSDTKLTAPHRNATTRELAQWVKASKPCLPRHAPVQYSHKQLVVDPYVLGAWLGDGTTGLGRMTSHPDDMEFMRAQFELGGYLTTTLTDPYSFGVKGLRANLHKLGVRDNKHIPTQYLTASIAQRMALLQGLMDTDGDVTEAGQCSFNNCNMLLAEQFRELIHSLGIKAKLHRYEDSRPNHNPIYRVTYKLKDCCRMVRKNSRTYTPTDKRCRSITVKETSRRADMQCITVERTDGLFLIGREYVVTHNSEQEAAIAASNPEIYDKVYEWYTSGPRQRLQPGGSIIIIQCMSGDTPVLMADGEETPLRYIRPNDRVATYDSGKLSTAKVVNWRSNGVDKVYEIKMTSGTIVRANERHPFLVDIEGVKQWIRLKNLKPGMSIVAISDAATYPAQKSRGHVLPAIKKSSIKNIRTNQERAMESVSLRGVLGPQGHKLNPDCAAHVNQQRTTTKTTPRPHITQSGITASIKISCVLRKAVLSLQNVKGCVHRTTKRLSGLRGKIGLLRKSGISTGLNAGTDLQSKSTRECSTNKGGSAPFAENLHHLITHGLTGTESYVSTTATILRRFGHYCATIATSLSDTQKQKKPLWQSQSTLGFTTDQIVEIAYSGEEEVFDVQIEGTENFIANGLVSHNTRWSKRDLTGQVLEAAKQRGSEDWRVVNLPAILPSGQPLWPEFWSIEELEATRDAIDVSKWQAQYQQNPTSEEGALIKREWWKKWPNETPPQIEFTLQTWDTAFEKHQRADYSACTTWGVFYQPDDSGITQANIILLDAKRGRYEFPELKQVVLDEYKYWEPDSIIIEKKASGAPLIYELRAMGIPVGEFTPTRGNDKIVRLNAVADLFASGRVWVPNTRFADEVVEEVAAFPAGQHDDYCFIAGTQILMADGTEKPIEQVEVGELVWSHMGAQRVKASGLTGIHLVKVLEAGEQHLKGTGGHKIYTPKGWKSLAELNRSDTIVTVSTNEEIQCQLREQDQISLQLSLKGIPIISIAIDPIMNVLGVGITYIEMYGRIITGIFQKGIIFTTSTETRQTTMWRTYSAYLQRIIDQSIPKIGELEEDSPHNWNIWKKLGLWQQGGIAPKRGWLGIGSTLRSPLGRKVRLNPIVKWFQWRWRAGCVQYYSYQRTQQGSTIVPTSVLAERLSYRKRLKCLVLVLKSVIGAVKTYIPCTVDRGFVTTYAKVHLVTPDEGPQSVYNITVENAHTYYANGILVSNCDTVSMAMSRFRKGGFITTNLDKEDEIPEFRGRSSYRTAYY